MKFHFYILLLATSINISAQDESIFSYSHKAPNINHTGDVWLKYLSKADSNFNYNIAVAKFAKDAKLNWHIHPLGQQLIVVDGQGIYQEKGKPVQILKMGDIVKSEPMIEHWHAATPNSGVTYLAISGNKKTVWTDSVSQLYFESINIDSLLHVDKKSELLSLSKRKWSWMSEKKIDELNALFHENSVFVHMGGSWGKAKELEIIESGGIWYKQANIHDVSIHVSDDSAVLLNEITLLAEVGGREVSNRFMVTETYKTKDDEWNLISLSFTKLVDK